MDYTEDFRAAFDLSMAPSSKWHELTEEQKNAVTNYAFHRTRQSERVYRQDERLLATDSIGADSAIRVTAFTERAAFAAAILVPEAEFLDAVMKLADVLAMWKIREPVSTQT